MSLTHIATGLAALMGFGIIAIGAWYVVTPQAIAKRFGLPESPHEDASAWLSVKGIRDIVSGLVVLVLLALGQLDALGWIALVVAITPTGDAVIVLRNEGSKGLAYGMHGATALAAVVIGCLLLLG